MDRIVLPPDECRALFDREAQRLLGISGEEFVRRWDAGEYKDTPDTPEGRQVMRVEFLLPFWAAAGD
jgi:hypothetical protein